MNSYFCKKKTLINRDDEPLITTSKISLSSTNVQSNDYPLVCRLCHGQGTNDEPLISPCNCLGTMRYLHQSCLQRLIKNENIKSCELCKCKFIIHAETKPFKQVKSKQKKNLYFIFCLVAKIKYESW